MWTWLLNVDYTVFTWINGLAGRNQFVDTIMRTFCNDHLVPFTLGFLVIVLALHGRNRLQDRDNLAAVVRLVMTLAIATAILQLIVVFVHRPRPFIDHEVNLLFYRPTDWSFPATRPPPPSPSSSPCSSTTGVSRCGFSYPRCLCPSPVSTAVYIIRGTYWRES